MMFITGSSTQAVRRAYEDTEKDAGRACLAGRAEVDPPS
jgi:hypothetical protein